MTEFDPTEATEREWTGYLLDSDNHIRDFDHPSGETTPKLKRLVDNFIEASLTVGQRHVIVTRAVQATLGHWHTLAKLDYGAYLNGSETPFEQVPRMAYFGNGAPEDLVQVVQRLWREAPPRCDEQTRKMVMIGLGRHLPMDVRTLEFLFHQDFDNYSMTVLRILLLKGEVEHATRLFEENATRYGDYDPGTFDHLILAGLPVKAARVWLDQSKNVVSGSGHYEDALEHWPKVAEWGTRLPEYQK